MGSKPVGKRRLLDKEIEPELAAYVQGVGGGASRRGSTRACLGYVLERTRQSGRRCSRSMPQRRSGEWMNFCHEHSRGHAACTPASRSRALSLQVELQHDFDWESATTKIQLEEVDVISFHDYGWPGDLWEPHPGIAEAEQAHSLHRIYGPRSRKACSHEVFRWRRSITKARSWGLRTDVHPDESALGFMATSVCD